MRQLLPRRETWLSPAALIFYLPILKLLMHLAVNHRYGFFRDELAYVDDGKHLAWGYVDHPPLSPFFAHLAHGLFGDSLSGYRLFAALATVGTVLLTGLIVRTLHGGRFAIILAQLCLFISPIYLSSGTLFQAVPFDQFFWTLTAYLLILLLKTNNPKFWLAIGLSIGLGLMTKYTILFFIAGMGIGLLLTPARRYLINKWAWLGGLIAVLIVLPHVAWQLDHDWVSFDYLDSINARDAAEGRTDDFLPEQVLLNHPLTVPVWLLGLYYYLRSRQGSPYRLLGWLFVTTFVLLLVMNGRGYYLGAGYPMLLAGGAVFIESTFNLQGWLRARPITVGLMIAGALVAIPFSLPVLSPGDTMWDTAIEMNESFVEMFGWEELAASVADVYQSLPPEEQEHTLILAGNYGEAGAMNLYRDEYNLPPVICGANTYYYWSQDRTDADIYIVLGFDHQAVTWLFEEAHLVGRVTNKEGIANEETEDYPGIFIARHPRKPLSEIWEELQSFG